jgi:hypothetical protein
MLPPGFFAVAVGIALFVLIAVVSLRFTRWRERRLRDGPMFPLVDHDADDGGDGGSD